METTARRKQIAFPVLLGTLALVPLGCLVGWAIDSPHLKAVVPGLTPMNPAVAICFILLSISLYLVRSGHRSVPGALAGIVGLAALCRIVATLSGQDKTIDTWLFASKLEAELRPNRMALTTACCLLAAAMAVLFLASPLRRKEMAAQICSLLAAVTGVIVVNCYASAVLAGQEPGTGVPMALQVAALFIVFCVATFIATPRAGISAVLMERTHGALFARRMMLSLLIAPPTLGWLTHYGQAAGLYGVEYKHALLITLLALGFAVVVWIGANANSKADAHIRGVEHELRAGKEQLEDRIQERTAQLTEANETLRNEIEERKSLQEQLLQSQKMESLGSLAGGVAHDFNNLLTGMLGYAELAQMKLPGDSPVQSDLDEVRKAAERAAALTKQLLTFARKEVVAPQIVNLNELTIGLKNLLSRLVGEDIELVVTAEENLGKVKVDPSQFEQVLMNLVVNARDAMPTGGKLMIQAENLSLDEPQPTHRDEMAPGEYVVLSVSDSGCGMPKELQAQVFDPFFTTKEKGKGTGLGLSTCYGIIRNSGGYIWIYSEQGTGTTFRIYLPRVDEACAGYAQDSHELAAGRGETVLVVEDEDTVRSLAIHVLRENGYIVLDAPDGASALQLMAECKEPIDLLVTDVIMPGMSGRELSEVVQVVRPEVKVLYMSGYTDDAMVHQGVFSQSFAFLQKPFTSAKLTRKVREVLDQQKAA